VLVGSVGGQLEEFSTLQDKGAELSEPTLFFCRGLCMVRFSRYFLIALLDRAALL
jgi:hypothetical protein